MYYTYVFEQVPYVPYETYATVSEAQKQIGVNRAAPLLENTITDLRSGMRSRVYVVASLAAVSL